jgi:Tol biopolymer transport system component
MTLRRIFYAIGTAFVVFSSCDLAGGGGGGGGAGGGGGTAVPFVFNKGFVFTRKDDLNVYIADESDFQTTATLSSKGGVFNPSLSLDGKLVVFVQKAGTTTTLMTVLATGSTPSELLVSDTQKANFRQPVFSPDGTKVAFAYDDGQSGSIGLINTDASNFQKLKGGGALGYGLPSFAPDGKSVLVAAGNVGLQLTQIERIELSTGLATSVTNTLGNEAVSIANRLVTAPDGTKAAFDARVSSGITRIFVIDLSTKVVTKVNEYMGEPNTNDSFPTWYSNALLAFSSDSGGNDNVYRIALDGTSRKLIVPKAVEPWYGPVQP